MPAVKHSLHDPAPAGDPARDPRGLPHRRAPAAPGPVVVDIPTDLSRADIPYEPVTDVHLPGYQPTTEGNAKQIRQAAKALAAARRPVIYAGGGVINANASEELTRARAVGPLPGHLHADGPRRVPGAARAVARACSACTARARRTTRWTRPTSSARSARASTTASPASCRSSRRARSSSTSTSTRPRSPRTSRRTSRSSATPRTSWRSSSASTARSSADPSRLDEWWQRIGGWQEKHPLRYDDSTDAEIKPQRMIEALYEATGGDAIVTSDVGQHQMWAAQYFHFNEPRRWINSGGLGTMGFGLPAAMGAAGRLPGRDGRLHRRRRLDPDEHAGARDLRPERHPGQGLHHEQRLPGHGPPVAGAVLGQALLARRHGPVPRTSSSSPRPTARPACA